MRNLRWQLLILLFGMVAIGVLLISRPPVLQPPIPEPTSGGIYTEGIIGTIERLNPIVDFYNPTDRAINRLMFSSLIRIDARGIPYAELAESWGISRDGRFYNFSLRPNAVWHDGEPVTSDDIVFTVQQLQSDTLPLPSDILSFWQQIEVKRLDERSLQFVLPEPFSPFLSYLTFGVLPQHLLGGLSGEELINSDLNLDPVGSGPYQFDRLLVEGSQIEGIVLSSFEDYFLDPPFIEQMVFRIYPDSVSALGAYQRGEVLGVSQITPEVLPSALDEPELNVYTGRLPQLSLILLNLEDPNAPFLQRSEIRRAMLSAINRQGIIDRLFAGQALIADGPIFPGTWAYFEGTERIPFDPQGAISLLRSEGYTIPAEGGSVRSNEEGPLSLTLVHPDTAIHGVLADEIRKYWMEIGVEATLLAVSVDELLATYLEPRAYQAALVDVDLGSSSDPDPYPFWHQTQISTGQNYANWDDRIASEYLEQARITTDLEERKRLYENFQARFNREIPSLPLMYPVYSYAVDQQVRGVRMGPLFDTSDRFVTVGEWFLLARQPEDAPGTPTSTP